MIKARVDVSTDFGRITREVNDLAKRAVTSGARVGAQTASEVASERSHTGTLAHMDVLPVRGSPDGWEASFRSRAYYRLFQDLGTLENRGTRLSAATVARRSSPSGQARQAKVAGRAGIEPLFFYRAGRRAGRAAMLAVIRGGL